jgi:hypothetical protein
LAPVVCGAAPVRESARFEVPPTAAERTGKAPRQPWSILSERITISVRGNRMGRSISAAPEA